MPKAQHAAGAGLAQRYNREQAQSTPLLGEPTLPPQAHGTPRTGSRPPQQTSGPSRVEGCSRFLSGLAWCMFRIMPYLQQTRVLSLEPCSITVATNRIGATRREGARRALPPCLPSPQLQRIPSETNQCEGVTAMCMMGCLGRGLGKVIRRPWSLGLPQYSLWTRP